MSNLDAQIAALIRMSPAALRSKWREVHRGPAPDLSPSLLARGIAYRLQERVHGGLSRSTEKQLANIARRLARTGSIDDPNAVSLKPGTRLVRSWNGTIYRVLVGDDGFEFDGRLTASNRRDYIVGSRSLEPSLLTGMLTDPSDRPMTPVHTAKGSRRYRYYVTRRSLGEPESDVIRIPTGPIEKHVIAMLDRRERFNALADGRSVETPLGGKIGYRRTLGSRGNDSTLS